MRTFYAASTAIALVLAGPVLAEEMTKDPATDPAMQQSGTTADTMMPDSYSYSPQGEEIRASGFIGARVYTAETDVQDEESWANWDGDNTDWDDVGEINDVLMSKDGEIEAILVDVGGFLGIGEKQIAVKMDELKLVSDGEDTNDYFVVFTSTKDELDAAPAYESEQDRRADMSTDTADEPGLTTDTTAVAPGIPAIDQTDEADTDTAMDMNAGNDGVTAMGDAEPQMMAAGEMSSEELTGARVYDANDKWIGEVEELTLTDEGKVQQIVMEVGGFLGIGEKRVAMDITEVDVQRRDGSDDLRVYVDTTKENLMDMPGYDG